MQSRSRISRRVGLLLASLITIFANSVAYAQENSYKASFGQNKDSIAVNVLVGQSRVINFDRPVGRFSVSNPDIAEAVLVTPDQVLVNGKAFGQVNFIAWEQTGGNYLTFDVYVRANLSLLDSQVRAGLPAAGRRRGRADAVAAGIRSLLIPHAGATASALRIFGQSSAPPASPAAA